MNLLYQVEMLNHSTRDEMHVILSTHPLKETVTDKALFSQLIC